MSDVELPQPKLLDFSKLNHTDTVIIEIINTQHKFSTSSLPSGSDVRSNPIFGSVVYINDVFFTSSNYGFPFIQFEQNTSPTITYKNNTLFTFNIHSHGLCTTGAVDGASMDVVFGTSTSLGNTVTFQFPPIENNSALLWYHIHNMFTSMELVYGGGLGLMQITDHYSKFLTKYFEYDNNNILLFCSDLDLNPDGTQTSVNLSVDENRSCFTAINGIIAVDWSKSRPSKYVDKLYRIVNKNLVKIDILCASLNWRKLYLGVCDKHSNVKCFYLVQTDCGLIDPIKTKMAEISVASRIGIIIDLDTFKDNKAYLFFYNYDLTENFGSVLTYPTKPNFQSLSATVPNFENNGTPYPSPIPDSMNLNQQENYTNLEYPNVDIIEQNTVILENGEIKPPKQFTIKIFLEIILDKKKDIKLEKVLLKIKNTVLDKKCNLNKKYFYNIPDIEDSVPKRNILLFFTDITLNYGIPFGATECINEANRIMVDLWNDKDLNIEDAIEAYNLNPNSYKPDILPSSRFSITPTNDEYSNITMISNDMLTIQVFDNEIKYGDFTTSPIKEIDIVFDPVTGLNITEFTAMINTTFSNTTVEGLEDYDNVADILTLDWSFFPYVYKFLFNKTLILKSAVIKILNKSNYYIRLLAKPPLLNLFGKPFTGGVLTDNSIKCDEYEIYGIYDGYIQQTYPYYATSDPNVQLPIGCMKKPAELIIKAYNEYIGFYDGYFNDNLCSFSVNLNSTEEWVYTNGDDTDSHPLHFHSTSAFQRYENITHSKDIFQIGPQQQTSFYLKWLYYSSNDKTSSPNIRGRGSIIHCHYSFHFDLNSMMIQYYINGDEESKDDNIPMIKYKKKSCCSKN